MAQTRIATDGRWKLGTLRAMSNLQKSGGYTPRRQREQRAYRLVVAGGGSGALGVITLVLAVVGAVSWFWPILLLVIAAACYGMFRGMTS